MSSMLSETEQPPQRTMDLNSVSSTTDAQSVNMPSTTNCMSTDFNPMPSTSIYSPEMTTKLDSMPLETDPLSQVTADLELSPANDKMNSELNKDRVCVLFIGNPGVGKSTLLNCLINQRNQEDSDPKILFQSGISFNTGMTKELNTAEIDGHEYMDTPGLEDTKIRKAAADAITEALKRGGRYQVVFVVTLEAGRVRPGDITTMNLVLESAKDISQYGVIFNKIGKRIFRELTDENKAELTSQISLCSLEHMPVPLSFFVQKSNDLDDENNAIINIDELDDFVSSIIPSDVNKDSVTQIPIESYEEMKEKIENDLEFLKSNNEEMRKKIEDDAMTYQAKIADAIARAEEEYEMKKEKLLQGQEKEISMMTKELEEIEKLKKMCELEPQSYEDLSAQQKKEEEENKMKKEKRLPNQQEEVHLMKKKFEYIENSRKPCAANLENLDPSRQGIRQVDNTGDENEFLPNKRKRGDEKFETYGVGLFEKNEAVLYASRTNAGTCAYQPSQVEILLKREAELKQKLRHSERKKFNLDACKELENERRRIQAAKRRSSSSFWQKVRYVGQVVVKAGQAIKRYAKQ